MALKMQQLIVLGLILAAAIAVGEACDCMAQHPQAAFCGADFVIRAEVLNRTRVGGPLPTFNGIYAPDLDDGSYEYNVQVKRVFKNIPSEKPYVCLNSVYSPIASSMCGTQLSVGTVYLMMGYVSTSEGRAEVDSCSYIRDWSKMTKTEKKTLWKVKRACADCKVRTDCFNDCKEEKDSCLYNPFVFGDHQCRGEQLCLKNRKGECKFVGPCNTK